MPRPSASSTVSLTSNSQSSPTAPQHSPSRYRLVRLLERSPTGRVIVDVFNWYPKHLPPTERKLLRKLDLCILVFACLSFFCKFLDQSNITNAYVSGMKEDIGAYGNALNYFNVAYYTACESSERRAASVSEPASSLSLLAAREKPSIVSQRPQLMPGCRRRRPNPSHVPPNQAKTVSPHKSSHTISWSADG